MKKEEPVDEICASGSHDWRLHLWRCVVVLQWPQTRRTLQTKARFSTGDHESHKRTRIRTDGHGFAAFTCRRSVRICEPCPNRFLGRGKWGRENGAVSPKSKIRDSIASVEFWISEIRPLVLDLIYGRHRHGHPGRLRIEITDSP